jgi:hypothetical protein
MESKSESTKEEVCEHEFTTTKPWYTETIRCKFCGKKLFENKYLEPTKQKIEPLADIYSPTFWDNNDSMKLATKIDEIIFYLNNQS